ncbi:high choriolytic enzyme 1-like [Protopterus annectens]|uniref:high choriolytic enzyme 1-like n=1 Tax=Protopterus annectens TaxID=7888 RepID=UPI001CFA3561|nr:high choriolytic enzyme 1-like [Protopterus annectens]
MNCIVKEKAATKAGSQPNPSENQKDIFASILNVNKGSRKLTRGGDIVLSTQRSAINCPSNTCFWPKSSNGLVNIPFVISSEYVVAEKAIIENAMQEFATATCVRFVNRTTETDYLNIVSSDGCWSYLGKKGGPQDVSLMKTGCLYKGSVQHELNHAVGFEHEQSRSDRDNYVTILWDNIAEGMSQNFQKVTTNNLGLSYDYSSVMHYGSYAFSKDSRLPTIMPYPDSNVSIGQRYGLSHFDVEKINRLYQCNICSSLLPNPSGNFSSADSFSNYPNNVSCVWLIRIPMDRIFLEFQSFAVSSSDTCTTEYIRIYDGNSKSAPLLLETYCDKMLPPSVLSSSTTMLVEFVASSTTSGFKASYSTVPCGGTLTNTSGSFITPYHPAIYPNLLECIWVIRAPTGFKISLQMNLIDVEFEAGCPYDYITIHDGGQTSSPKKGIYCGKYNMPLFTSAGNAVVIQFHTDESIQGIGFAASYKFVN